MDHGGMVMGGNVCKISMMWNWNTVDTCFIAWSWHIRSQGAFAASCIGVVFLVVALEFLRCISKEYDTLLVRKFRQSATHGAGLGTLKFRATILQQFTRAVLHAITFGVAYFVMLLAMYYNGYIIISIFLGAGLGKFLSDWLVVDVPLCESKADVFKPSDACETTLCCG